MTKEIYKEKYWYEITICPVTRWSPDGAITSNEHYKIVFGVIKDGEYIECTKWGTGDVKLWHKESWLLEKDELAKRFIDKNSTNR